jgi:hypothetical protein
VCFQSIINLPPSLFIWLIYLVPSYSMSGLYMQSLNDYEGFYVYIGVMLLYLVGRPKVHLDFYLSGTAQRHRSNNFGADTDRFVRLVWLSDPLQGSTGVRQVVGVRQSHDLDSAVPAESRVVPRGHRQQFRADVLQEQTSATSGHHRPVALSHRERHPSLVELRISDVAVEVLQLRKHSHSFGCFLYHILRSRVFSVLVLSTQKFKK